MTKVLLTASALSVLTSLAALASEEVKTMTLPFDDADNQSLIDAGFVLRRPEEEKDADGNVEYIASTAGVEYIAALPAEETVQTPAGSDTPVNTSVATASENAGFTLETGITPPKTKVQRTSKYPFTQMVPGNSFHVPVSEDTPEPWKSVQSAVSAANRDAKDERGVSEIKFSLRRMMNGEVDGARVFCLENDPADVQLERIAKRKARAEAKAAAATAEGNTETT